MAQIARRLSACSVLSGHDLLLLAPFVGGHTRSLACRSGRRGIEIQPISDSKGDVCRWYVPSGAGHVGQLIKLNDVLPELRIPIPPAGSGAYVELERKVGDFATAAVAAQVALIRPG
jgi:hypothetical protein